MKLTNTLLALGLAALPASALALDEFSKGDDAATLVQKLGDKDYKVRRDAYKQLEKLGVDARAALETAAKSDDAEVRWNASRLLDHLDSQTQGGGLKERVDPAQRDQDDDARDDSPQAGATDWRGFPRDLQQQMLELERRMQEMQQHFGQGFGQGWVQRFGQGGDIQLQPGSSFSRSSTTDGRTESFTLRVDADGHVTAEQQKDGKTTKFEADSIEAFRNEHPEMLRRGPVSLAIRPFAPNDTAPVTPKKKSANHVKAKAQKVETQDPADMDASTDRAAKAAPKPRLGVELAPVAPELAEYLELDGDAFQVVRVLDDMPAAKRGLKPRDILLEVNGQAVHAFDDVVKALDGTDPNTVKVVVLRRGQRKEL